LDADFLAFYGIDIEIQDLAGPRFFALAERTFAYGGVMARRAENEQDGRTERPTSYTPDVPASQRTQEQWRAMQDAKPTVSTAAVVAQSLPGWISASKVSG
jgi:hypothetical protein